MSANPKALEHFWLVAGCVVFTRQGEDTVETISLNTMITNKIEQVTARHVGRAQQSLQMLLFQRLGVEIQVHDVFIISVSYLGRMSTEAFNEGVGELTNE